ncbi:MAG: MFS transporter [Bryobacteraceae bacterium]|nr:MFS transporter [Bryobacteraceae bacterium]
MPVVTFLFVLCFLDRVNLSFAALDMTKDLGLSPSVYGFGAGIFFWGYLLCEIPAARLVERRSASFWLGLMLVLWGAAATLMGTVNTVGEFYAYRVVLGIAEAGFFPGILIYLSRWFPQADRARAVGALAVGLPAANLLGAPVSGWLLAQTWWHVPGWRWVFIVEGLPSVIAGVLVMLFLTNRPRDARWLTQEERHWLEDTLARDHAANRAKAAGGTPGYLHGLFLLLVLIWFLDNVGVYGFNLWLPMILRRLSGYSSAAVAFLSATPFVGALIAAAVVSLSSDRRKERRWHTAGPMMIFGCGMALSVLLHESLWWSVGALSIAALGLTSGTPGFWAIATSHYAGSTHIAIITSAGALGGMAGPVVMGYLRELTGDFLAGLTALSFCVVLAGCLVLMLRRRTLP